jgi:hypothetical protein
MSDDTKNQEVKKEEEEEKVDIKVNIDPEDISFYCYISNISKWDSFSLNQAEPDSEFGFILEEWKVESDEINVYRASDSQVNSEKLVSSMKETEVSFPLYKFTKNGKLICTVSYRGKQTETVPEEGFDLDFLFHPSDLKVGIKIRSSNSVNARFCKFYGVKSIKHATVHKENQDIREFFHIRNENIEKEIIQTLTTMRLKEKYSEKIQSQKKQ